ncbi:efflux RND transporter permease subunit [Bordetella pertussis]
MTTVSFNLAPGGASLSGAVEAISAVQAEIGLPLAIDTRFQGAALAFQNSLRQQRCGLILAAVVTMYIVLGILYESYIHPITILFHPAFGRGGGAAGPADQRHRPGHDSIIGCIGIVKKNAIIDFALEPSASAGWRRAKPGDWHRPRPAGRMATGSRMAATRGNAIGGQRQYTTNAIWPLVMTARKGCTMRKSEPALMKGGHECDALKSSLAAMKLGVEHRHAADDAAADYSLKSTHFHKNQR